MSAIPSVLPSGTGITTDGPVSLARNKQAASQYTPLGVVGSGDSRNAFELLGIRLPNANGDIATLLAEVSLELEKSVDESRKKRVLNDLASLASALAGTSFRSLQREVATKEKRVDNAKATLDETTSRMEPLEQQRTVQIERIQNYRDQIEHLQAALADPDLTSEKRAQLQSQLAVAQDGLSGAMGAREAIDIKLANVRIESLDRQVADLEALLEDMSPDSDEAAGVQAELSARRAEAKVAVEELEVFRQGPKTEPAQDAFSKRNINLLHAMVQALTEKLHEYEAALAVSRPTLENAMYFEMAAAASASSAFRAQQAGQADDDGIRDQGIERAFERIADNLGEAAEASLATVKKLQRHDDERATDLRREQIQTLAGGIVDSLGDLVAILSRLGSAQLPIGVPPPIAAHRVRFDI